MWVWNLADCCDALWEDSGHFPLPAAGGSMGKSIITHLSSPSHVFTSGLLRPVYFKSSIPVLQSCLHLKTWRVVHHFWILILIKKKLAFKYYFSCLLSVGIPLNFVPQVNASLISLVPALPQRYTVWGISQGLYKKMIVVRDSVSIILFLSITPY